MEVPKKMRIILITANLQLNIEWANATAAIIRYAKKSNEFHLALATL